MVLSLLTTTLDSNAANSVAFNQLIEADKLGSLLKGDADQMLTKSFKSNWFSTQGSLNLLSSIIARVDLTQESRIKEIVSTQHPLSNFCLNRVHSSSTTSMSLSRDPALLR
jgi:hypothetical protein